MKNKGLRRGRPYGLRYAAGFFLVLYAAWFAACDDFGGSVEWITYSIVYHANDGSNRTEIFTHRYGTSHYIRENMFFGHDVPFLGWAGSPRGDRVFDEGDPVQRLATSAGQTINLYAMWDGFIVTFDVNGGFGNSPRPMLGSGGVTLPPGTGFFKAGHVFAGWNATAGGSEGFLEFEVTEDITLFAVWEPVFGELVTIAFNVNGGEGNTPSITRNAGASVRLPNDDGLSKAGHVFAGWSKTSDGSTDILLAGSSFPLVENMTLYAMWALRFTVVFHANGGTGDVPQGTGTTDVGVTLPYGGGFSRPGYYFAGWNTMANGAGEGFVPGQNFVPDPPVGNVTLYAVWNPVVAFFVVEFNLNGGPGTVPYPKAGGAGFPITLPLLENGFVGWNTMADGTGDFQTSPFEPTENVTLYAVWE